jgi:hypothetical protein
MSKKYKIKNYVLTSCVLGFTAGNLTCYALTHDIKYREIYCRSIAKIFDIGAEKTLFLLRHCPDVNINYVLSYMKYKPESTIMEKVLHDRTITGHVYRKFICDKYPIIVAKTQDEYKEGDNEITCVCTNYDPQKLCVKHNIDFTTTWAFLHEYDKNKCSRNGCYVRQVIIRDDDQIHISGNHIYSTNRIRLGSSYLLPDNRFQAIVLINELACGKKIDGTAIE